MNDPTVSCEIEGLQGDRPLLMCCDATDLCLELLPVESSVCRGNDRFDVL